MADVEELRSRLNKAAEIADMLDRRLWVLAVITERLSEMGVRPVLVGGAAVEFYAGGYSTNDLDMVLEPAGDIAFAMEELGFARAGRFWSRDDIDIILETPAGPLAGDYQRIVEVDVDGFPVYVIGIEDLIIDRLNACAHWQSKEDGRWAALLLCAVRGEVDLDYLRQRANQEHVGSELSQILEGLPQ